MPARCDVCSSSFKESNAQQMHKVAKHHNQSAAGNASGQKPSRDQAQPKAKPSNTGASPLDNVTSSGGLTFRCNSCDRSCRSREALEAHAKAKAHLHTITASVKRPEKAYFRCDVCSRCDFGSQTALNDHMRDSEDHQNRNQHSAPQGMLSDSQTRTNHRLPLGDRHSLALTVDKWSNVTYVRANSRRTRPVKPPCLQPRTKGRISKRCLCPMQKFTMRLRQDLWTTVAKLRLANPGKRVMIRKNA